MELGELREAFAARDFDTIARSEMGDEEVAWFNRSVESYGVGVCCIVRGEAEAWGLSPLRHADRVRFCPDNHINAHCQSGSAIVAWWFWRWSMVFFGRGDACFWRRRLTSPQDLGALGESGLPCFPCVDTCEV